MRTLSCLLIFLISLAPAMASESILLQAAEEFQSITRYSATLRSFGNSDHIISYRYQKPGYVCMDFVKPHKGAALVYRPDTGKVQLRPFGFSKFLKFTMKPTAKLVLSPSGHGVDESDLGALLENAQRLAQQGSVEVLREEIKHETPMLVVKITGEPEALVDGVHSYLLWMDKSLKLPRIVESYDEQEQLIEGLFIDDLRINPVFGEIFDL
jgi:outer membrane lipoprotein-sorting protein